MKINKFQLVEYGFPVITMDVTIKTKRGKKMDFKVCNQQLSVLDFYYRFNEEKFRYVPNETADFYIKSIMCGVKFNVYVYKGVIIHGEELYNSIFRCFSGNLIFTSDFIKELNGKKYDEIDMKYHKLLEDGIINIVEIDKNVKIEDLDYFMDKVKKCF